MKIDQWRISFRPAIRLSPNKKNSRRTRAAGNSRGVIPCLPPKPQIPGSAGEGGDPRCDITPDDLLMIFPSFFSPLIRNKKNLTVDHSI